MQSSSKTSEIDKRKMSKDDKHGNRYKIPSNKNTINEHALTSSYNVQYFYVQSSDYWMLSPTPE